MRKRRKRRTRRRKKRKLKRKKKRVTDTLGKDTKRPERKGDRRGGDGTDKK